MLTPGTRKNERGEGLLPRPVLFYIFPISASAYFTLLRSFTSERKGRSGKPLPF